VESNHHAGATRAGARLESERYIRDMNACSDFGWICDHQPDEDCDCFHACELGRQVGVEPTTWR
jgi:hypothetical protein